MILNNSCFLTDENIHPDVAAFMRSGGLDVVTAMEAGLCGASDTEVLRRAGLEHRVVVTHDPDFGSLAVMQRVPIVGIVYLRPGHAGSVFTIGTVRALLDQRLEVSRPFMVVAKRTGDRVAIRLRNP